MQISRKDKKNPRITARRRDSGDVCNAVAELWFAKSVKKEVCM